MIFEEMIRKKFYFRFSRNEEIISQADISIADILGSERQKDFTMRAVGHNAGKHVKEKEESGLTAIGESDILRADIPAKLIVEHFSQGRDKRSVTLGAVIVTDQLFKAARGIEDGSDSVSEPFLHFWNMAGIAATEHEQIFITVEGLAQIGHELHNT